MYVSFTAKKDVTTSRYSDFFWHLDKITALLFSTPFRQYCVILLFLKYALNKIRGKHCSKLTLDRTQDAPNHTLGTPLVPAKQYPLLGDSWLCHITVTFIQQSRGLKFTTQFISAILNNSACFVIYRCYVREM